MEVKLYCDLLMTSKQEVTTHYTVLSDEYQDNVFMKTAEGRVTPTI